MTAGILPPLTFLLVEILVRFMAMHLSDRGYFFLDCGFFLILHWGKGWGPAPQKV